VPAERRAWTLLIIHAMNDCHPRRETSVPSGPAGAGRAAPRQATLARMLAHASRTPASTPKRSTSECFAVFCGAALATTADLTVLGLVRTHQGYTAPTVGGLPIEMTIPDKPRSSKQRYRLTPKGTEARRKR
jgi:hypothetical protein